MPSLSLHFLIHKMGVTIAVLKNQIRWCLSEHLWLPERRGLRVTRAQRARSTVLRGPCPHASSDEVQLKAGSTRD